MNYVNYEKSIIHKYRIKLIGWPENIKFVNPVSLTSMEELWQLQQALRTRVFPCIKLTDHEVRQHVETTKQWEASGEQVGCKRKQCSDKGKLRKKVACLDEEDDTVAPDKEGNQPFNPEDPGPSDIQTCSKTCHNSHRIFKSKAMIDSDAEHTPLEDNN